MVQVENEMGYLGPGRDRSPEADRELAGPVPQELMGGLAARRTEFSPELAAHFNPQGRAWREVFGAAANEVFMAWRDATFVQSVGGAGKRSFHGLAVRHVCELRRCNRQGGVSAAPVCERAAPFVDGASGRLSEWGAPSVLLDRKSTRLNSSHRCISY